MCPQDIHPITDHLVNQKSKETLLGQKGAVFWLCGLSGSGKSTLAIKLEKDLHECGFHSVVLDGDNLRETINQDLSFNDKDRKENIRRIAQLSKLLSSNGIIVIVSAITPKESFRIKSKEIIGEENYYEIFVNASYEKCSKRDVKGLYAKADKGLIQDFTGKKSNFEEPQKAWLTINTEEDSVLESSNNLLSKVIVEIKN